MRGVLVTLSAVLLLGGCQGFETPASFARSQIGPAGGEISSLDGVFRIVVPAGALVVDHEFRIEKLLSTPRGGIGGAYEVRPNISLGADATFIYDYSETDVGDGRPLELLNVAGNFRYNGVDRWTPLRRDSFDIQARTVSSNYAEVGVWFGLVQDDSLMGDTSSTETGTDTIDSDSAGTTGAPMTSTTSDDTSTSGEGDATTEGDPDTEASSSGAGDSASTSEGDASTTSSGEAACGDGTVNAGEICLTEDVAFAAPAGASSIVAFDVNDDDNTDVVVAGDGTLYVLHGTGAGVLRDRETYTIGAAPVALAAGNFGGGSELDVAVLSGGDATVGVMLNASGTLDDVVPVDLAAESPVALLAARLNDGTNLDVAVLGQTSSDVSVLFGDGDGGLEFDDAVATLDAPTAFASGDFNGDGDLDLVVVSATELGVHAGNGMGLFGAVQGDAIADAGTAIAAADFNGDGNTDAAVATTDDTVVVYPGDGIGGFGAGVPYSVGEGPVALVVADLSGDGIDDLVSVNEADGSVSILVGRSSGGFADVVTLAMGSGPRSVAAGDFNGDGALDLAAADADSGEVVLLLSSP